MVDTNNVTGRRMDTVDVVMRKLPNGTLLELIYDPYTESAQFVVVQGDGFSKQTQYEFNGQIYRPLVDKIIQGGFVQTPSDVGELGEINHLHADVMEFISTCHDMNEDDLFITTRYVFASYLFDRFDRFGYLRIIGDYGTGKSRFLELMSKLCYRGIYMGGGYSEPVIYRILAQYPGTLCLDEADFSHSTMQTLLTKILNTGYQQSGVVWRCGNGKNNYPPEVFPTFGPKCLAARGYTQDDGLESRMISMKSYQTKRNDLPTGLNEASLMMRFIDLKNRLFSYRIGNWHSFSGEQKVSGEDEFDPRLAEILRPLSLAVNESEMHPILKSYARQLSEERVDYRRHSLEGITVQELSRLIGSDEPLLVGGLTECVNRNLDDGEKIKPRSVGVILDKLEIERKKINRGYQILLEPERLRELQLYYGIV